jgi:N-acetylglucosaminyl-diphospho-decaprenol L-rhamnosyltransferase
VALRLLGANGRAYRESFDAVTGRWSLHERWASGAVVSFPVDALRAVGGFDPRYFLYVEDLDLCERLGARHPTMSVVVADVRPAHHAVGGTASHAARRPVELHRARSWHTYARSRSTIGWRIAALLVGLRVRWLSRG